MQHSLVQISCPTLSAYNSQEKARGSASKQTNSNIPQGATLASSYIFGKLITVIEQVQHVFDEQVCVDFYILGLGVLLYTVCKGGCGWGLNQ